MKARVVIVGGGVIGLSVAYHLSRLGWRDVVVVERDHLNAGASGRCGGGVREQWSSAMNIDLMRRSIELFRDLAVRTGENIWFRQGGYLFLAKTEEQAASLETSVRLQNDHGVPTRLLSKSAVRRRCPYLNTEDVMVGTFNPNDGTLFPFSVVWAYARAVADYGNTVMTHTRVTGIEREGDRMIAVQTDKGRIETSFVVNAAGAWSPEIGNMVGIDLPNHPEKHEAIVTEALRGFLGPESRPHGLGSVRLANDARRNLRVSRRR
ncbi:MAG: FAD-binding oxidoreductase [Deltaproteobacteria bacterium]|nr:FAD-binding oxidoreductase [Deltaproteobacteria bacterium]